ncbi:glycoside hydrolase family 2 protein [Amaricoccus solimangrovi]|uniref:beta-mannosidase n=1 Tax=Amaricoccus solimangrovi TaxID=2589815 RepID=A0A501WJM3_9RHOB|nr:glycoside hydrolase family 2 protein [Amaricoccus solimangrovi]TPE49558.1 glycoside hydrolase family 2 protein [Amaricoccus solimangrovi]
MLDLTGDWTLRDAEGEYATTARLPGDVHSALQAAGMIPDPYAGRNEYDLRWIADRDWILSRRFEDTGGARLLHFDCLDTLAEVRLNGAPVLEAATSFRGHDAAVETLAGENRIEITLRSNTRAADALAAAQPFPVPYHRDNCPIPNGNMLRKPQCDFGWDWGIALAPTGVHGRIALIGPEGEIAGPVVEQVHEGGAVRLRVRARLRGFAPGAAPWRIAVGSAEAAGEIDPAASEPVAELVLGNPALWWPSGYGEQPLHALEIAVGGQRRTFPLAIRDIRLVSEPDAAGRSFLVRVNGRDVFCRGANWVPADSLPGRITPERTTALLRSAAGAGMNMIRVWGGGRYEPDSFYETCDALGLLVWQDCMFACHLYPATAEFLGEVDREIREQAARIGHHVALWCGDNELLGALNWFEESRANRDRYLVAYDRLNRTIERALVETLPGANWWPSSPSPGPMSFGDPWHDDGAGDMHFWSVWHEGRDFEHYRDVKPRFCSEFGFQSHTSLPVIRSFASEADLNIASPVMESHQKNAGGNARIAETMFRYFRFPKDFASFVWLSQIQQGVAIKTAADYWRSLKPRCMGALYWQLNDTWPVASWSSLDYGGGWKLTHHMAARFFRPVNVVAIPEGGAIRLVGVNDTAGPVEIGAEAFAVTLEGMARPLATAGGRVGTEAAHCLAELPRDALAAGEILAFRWSASDGASGGDIHVPERWKNLDLPDPGVTLALTREEGALRARLSARAVAFFVTLEASKPGRFSTNAITLFPGHAAEIVFTPEDGDTAGVTLTTRDLHSSFA